MKATDKSGTGKRSSKTARLAEQTRKTGRRTGTKTPYVTVSLDGRVQAASARLGLSFEAVVAAIEVVALQAPAGAEAPATSLSQAEEAVLREAGSLAQPMPELADRASFQTALAYERMMKDALTVKQVAERLSVSDGRVRQRLVERTLIGIMRDGTWRLPAFQFTDTGDLPGLAEVLPAFPEDAHPVAVQRFLDAVTTELEVDGAALSPRRWLATGGAARRVADLVREAYELL